MAKQDIKIIPGDCSRECGCSEAYITTYDNGRATSVMPTRIGWHNRQYIRDRNELIPEAENLVRTSGNSLAFWMDRLTRERIWTRIG